MGKKSKKSKSANGDSDIGMPRHVRRDILELCNSILEKCSVQFGSQQGTEWNDFMDVYKIVEKLRKKQAGYVMPRSKADAHAVEFVEWLKSNGVQLDAVTIERYGDMGHGLKATKNLNTHDLFLSIPLKLMMTGETAKASILGPLIQSDRMLKSMPNVVMALHLLCELAQPESFWQPYLNMLPEAYTTCLYFTPDDLQHLKASPVQSDFLNQFRSITRQYAYFFKLFQKQCSTSQYDYSSEDSGHPDTGKLPIKNFCYDDYRWAVSTVMTRQNDIPLCTPWDSSTQSNAEKNASKQSENENVNNSNALTVEEPRNTSEKKSSDVEKAIEALDIEEKQATEGSPTVKDSPDSDGQKDGNETEKLNEKECEEASGKTNVARRLERETLQTALIPLWDMCNHHNGHLTTGFDPDTGLCECYTLKEYKRGEQVLIFYGPRCNAEFLLHCGFVYDDNVHDKLPIKLGLSKNDPLYSLKAEVLSRVLPSGLHIFYLWANPASPVDPDMLAYLRVFALDKDTLYHLIVGEKAALRREYLRDFERPISRDNELKAWSFLEARCQLLARSYATTIEEDEELINSAALSACAKLAMQLRRCEKRILLNTAAYANAQLQRWSVALPTTSERTLTDAEMIQQGRDEFDRSMRKCVAALGLSDDDNHSVAPPPSSSHRLDSEECFVRDDTQTESVDALSAADILVSFKRDLEKVADQAMTDVEKYVEYVEEKGKGSGAVTNKGERSEGVMSEQSEEKGIVVGEQEVVLQSGDAR